MCGVTCMVLFIVLLENSARKTFMGFTSADETVHVEDCEVCAASIEQRAL